MEHGEARLAAAATRRSATISSGSSGFLRGRLPLRRGFGRQARASATRSEANPMKQEKKLPGATAASSEVASERNRMVNWIASPSQNDSLQRYLNGGLRAARNGAAQLKPGET